MYTVKILEPKEFNKLPFKRVKERPDDILGAADPSSMTAYIKDTGYNDLTKHVIGHELDELIAKVSPHEEDGIRYKDFSQSLGDFGAKAPGILGNVGSGIGKVVGTGVDLLGQGARAVGLPSFNIGNPSPAAGGTTPAAPANLNNPGGVFGKFGNGVNSYDMNSVMKTLNSGGGNINTFTPTGQLESFAKPLAPYANPFVGAPSTPPTASSAVSPGSNYSTPKLVIPNIAGGAGQGQQTDFWSSMKDAVTGDTGKKALSAFAINQIGNMLAPKVDTPDFGGVASSLRNQMATGVNPEVKGAAIKQILDEFNSPLTGEAPEGAYIALKENILQQKQEALDNLTHQFRAAQGGRGANALLNSDYANEVAKINEYYAETLANAISTAQYQYDMANMQERLNYIQQALGMEESQMQQLMNIAMLDVADIANKYGVSVSEAQQFKEVFKQSSDVILQDVFSGGQQ